uniref:Uncharacterized protein n=1 Tax=Strombidium inclinatum TaxID=197538 RepID=A0A7S3IIL6_9SPIT|mmetsp:Transcript_19218/g.29456  ORF Transcript_19218/g.29456 Transcript_19218/m.29456 type:complete len:227 (+) Transcript_19218:152-832(+)
MLLLGILSSANYERTFFRPHLPSLRSGRDGESGCKNERLHVCRVLALALLGGDAGLGELALNGVHQALGCKLKFLQQVGLRIYQLWIIDVAIAAISDRGQLLWSKQALLRRQCLRGEPALLLELVVFLESLSYLAPGCFLFQVLLLLVRHHRVDFGVGRLSDGLLGKDRIFSRILLGRSKAKHFLVNNFLARQLRFPLLEQSRAVGLEEGGGGLCLSFILVWAEST